MEATAAGVCVNGYTNGRENVSKRLQLAYILTVSVQGNKFKHLEQKMSEPDWSISEQPFSGTVPISCIC